MAHAQRVTARDVAARAGVAPSTVSKALSGKGAIHPDTVNRILDAARELGFKTRSEANQLRHPLNPTIGVVIRDPFLRRTAPVLLGALEGLAEQDFALLLCDGRGDPIREEYLVDRLLSRGIAGILVAGGSNGSFTRPPLRSDVSVPVVYLMTASTDPTDIAVVPDDRGGAELAARHLVETGRRALACVLGPSLEEAARVKTAATKAVLETYGLSLVTEPLCGRWDESWGRQATLQLINSGIAFDGLICGNDVLARGATSALVEAGLSVPGDVGVIGFDNWDVMVEGNRPQLSTIDLNLTEVGRVAAARITAEILHKPTTGNVTVIECQLVPRESTATTLEATAKRRAANTLTGM